MKKVKFFNDPSPSINSLPDFLIRHIDPFLNSKDSFRLATVSREFRDFSNQRPLSISEQRKLLRKFLNHVVHGEYEQVRAIVLQDSQLLFHRDSATDYSGRRFDSISGFEYALWALDKYLWDDMLFCLPRDDYGNLTSEGRDIVQELLKQYIKIRDEGITYRLNQMIKTEVHYDFAIINEFQSQMNAQINAQIDPANADWQAIDKQLCEGVGGAQLLAPPHVVDEYCSKRHFTPIPQFNSRPQIATVLTKEREFWNSRNPGMHFWFTAPELGTKCAISKCMAQFRTGEGFAAAIFRLRQGSRLMQLESEALIALRDTRMQNFIELGLQLQSLLEEHPVSRPRI